MALDLIKMAQDFEKSFEELCETEEFKKCYFLEQELIIYIKEKYKKDIEPLEFMKQSIDSKEK